MKIERLVDIGVTHNLTIWIFDLRLLSPLAASNASTVQSFPWGDSYFLPSNAVSRILDAVWKMLRNLAFLVLQGDTTSLQFFIMKWCFNETDHDENRIVGWHRHYERFDVFGFLIRGFWARWQRATRALFSHSLSYWLFLPHNAISHILDALKNILKTKLSNQSQLIRVRSFC